MNEQEFEIHNSNQDLVTRIITSVIILGLIAYFAIYALSSDSTRSISLAVGLLISTPFVLYSLLRCVLLYLNKGPQIAINDAGIYDYSLGVGSIPWQDIVDVELVEHGSFILPTRQYVQLRLRNEHEWLARMPITTRMQTRFNRRYPNLTGFFLNHISTKQDPRHLYDIVKTRLEDGVKYAHY